MLRVSLAAPPPSSPVPLIAYLVAVTWALMHSSKRWMTLLWIVGSLAVMLSLLYAASLIWPDLAGTLGYVAAIPTLLVSGLAGINHMRTHRRPDVPKTKP